SEESLAPPTWSTSRLDRSLVVLAAACSQTSASGGTTAVIVTRSRSMIGKATSGLGEGLSATVPPAYRVPNTPGELIGKLWAMGSTPRYTLSGPSPQISALARKE